MAIDLYYVPDSPPCRAVLITAAALGVELNLIKIGMEGGEHLKPDFLKLNPQHTVPTMKDGDFILWESRPIMAYLVNKYGKDDQYYPKDPVKRALVDQRMYFDMGTLYDRFASYYYPQILEKKPGNPELFAKIEESYAFLDKFLEGSKYAAGEELTIADFTLVVSVSTNVDGGANFSLAKYPNVQRWYEDCKKNIPHYEKSLEGLEAIKAYFVGVENPQKE